MPINKETIISGFDDKLTLMQWLKTIEKALNEAVLTGVEITKKGNATLSFKFTFEDGTYLETNDLVLQQGESVVNAFIQNGHLYLTLSNGTNLDAGNVKPVSNFSIDANQHLIVNYADGTSQDLGAIFNGDIDINGSISANGFLKPYASNERYDAEGSGFTFTEIENLTATTFYKHARVSNGKLNVVMAIKVVVSAEIVRQSENWLAHGGQFFLPIALNEKLYTSDGTTTSSGSSAILATMGGEYSEDSAMPSKYMKAFATITKEGIDDTYVTLYTRITLPPQTIQAGTYILRFEANFIL